MTPKKPSCSFLFLLAPVLITGCADSGNISGKVTFEGRPVVVGTVMVSAQGRTYHSMLQIDGGFSISDVPAGDVRIIVNSLDPAKYDLRRAPREPNGEFKKGSVYTKPPLSDLLDKSRWFPIPPQGMGIPFTVAHGENRYDIEL